MSALRRILRAPVGVFTELRDDSNEAAQERQEAVLLVILLAGIAWVLSTSTAARLLDDSTYDGLLVVVWAFIGGSLYGAFAYFAAGGLLHFGAVGLGSSRSYRADRHLLAFAAVPVALSLVLWPLRLALFGGDWFRAGGSDSGAAGTAFVILDAGFLVWTIALVVVGLRVVNAWSWRRALAALGLAVALPLLLALVYLFR